MHYYFERTFKQADFENATCNFIGYGHELLVPFETSRIDLQITNSLLEIVTKEGLSSVSIYARVAINYEESYDIKFKIGDT